MQNYSYRLGGYFIRLLSAYEPGGVGRVKMGAGIINKKSEPERHLSRDGVVGTEGSLKHVGHVLLKIE